MATVPVEGCLHLKTAAPAVSATRRSRRCWPPLRLLEDRSLRTVSLDLSDLEKAEVGPSCLCLVVEV